MSSDPLKRVSGGGNENQTRSLVDELDGIECEDGVNTSSHLRLASVVPLPSNQSDMGLFEYTCQHLGSRRVKRTSWSPFVEQPRVSLLITRPFELAYQSIMKKKTRETSFFGAAERNPDPTHLQCLGPGSERKGNIVSSSVTDQ